MKLDEKNTNLATGNFVDTLSSVVNKYSPLKKVNKYMFRFKKIAFGIQKSVYTKNKLLTKFISKKDPQIKAVFHEHTGTSFLDQ